MSRPRPGGPRRSPEADAPTATSDDREAEQGEAELPTIPAHGRAAPDRRAEALPDGRRLGKFTLGRKLGAGGMGVVYEAQDEVLHRRVAIKLLHLDVQADTPRAQRLLREARAAAGVTHPNVVAIHEVGVGADGPYIAMEYVNGQSLRAWLALAPRSWREVTGVFLPAAHGLAAAHRAGVIHRDVKPDNILVGADRVRVADFGVARAAGAAAEASASASEEAPAVAPSTIAGTPRYMAPEQQRGAPIDARADQYSFCLSFYEALHGGLPEEAGAAQAGAVPGWLDAAIARGIAADPAARFLSMQELVRALERGLGRRRRQLVGLGGVALAGGIALAAWAAARGRAAGPPLCRGAREHLAGVWDADVRVRVDAAAARDGRPWATGAAARFAALAGDYADRWVTARTEACEATHRRGEQSAALLDLRMLCLDRRRDALAELTALAATGSPELLDKAAQGGALPAIADCADAAALLAAVPPPADPAARARVAELRRRLDRANLLGLAGRRAEALPLARDALQAGTELGDAAVEAEAGYRIGSLLAQQGDGTGAENAQRAAALAAARARDDRLLAQTTIGLVFAIGYLERRAPEGLAMAATAEALVERAGGDPALRSNLANSRGSVRAGAFQLAEARADFQLAIDSDVAAGRDPLDAISNLANVAALERQDEESLALRRRALALVERRTGTDHPDVAMAHRLIARALWGLGRLDDTEQEYRTALAIAERAAGASSVAVADALFELSTLQAERGQHEAAAASADRAVAIMVERLGEQDGRVADALDARADVARMAGRVADQCRDVRRALAISERLAPARAQALAEEQFEVGMCAETPVEAIALFERSLATSALPGGLPLQIPLTRFALAKAQWLAGRRDVAVATAKQALDEMTSPYHAEARVEVEAWLAARRRGR